LQTLQIQQIGICRKFPSETCISHYRSDECFVEGQFNVTA
jgi:hypothetical protein